MLTKIKALLGLSSSDKDNLLQLLIDQTIDEIVAYTHNPHCVCLLENVVCEIVVIKYNRLGTEGLNSESYSGVNFSYMADYPESIIRCLKSHRKIITR